MHTVLNHLFKMQTRGDWVYYTSIGVFSSNLDIDLGRSSLFLMSPVPFVNLGAQVAESLDNSSAKS